MPVEWQRLKDGFNAALQLEPELRDSFVDDVCGGESELKHELKALLRAHQDASTFFSDPLGVGRRTARETTPGVQPVHPRFELIRPLGEGGMGIVYLALDHDHQAQVALKTIAKMSAASLLRFKNEFRALADVAHPNLVRLFELLGDERTWFFTMEYVEGESFLKYVRPSSLDVGRLRTAFGQLVEAVATIHAAGKLHCDLKPSNVLVSGATGRVVVLDFGLVTEIEAPIWTSSSLGVAGTLPFMSPEQARGERLTQSSDWYSVGVMLYEALTGRLPIDGADLADVLARKQSIDPPSPLQVDAAVPPDLSDLCSELLDRDPRRRPGGASILRRLERPSPVAPTGQVRFVGRANHLAVLHSALHDVRAGKQQTVFIQGPSGVGKSALTRRFLEELDGDTLTLAARCYERESVPYKAFDPMIDMLAARLGTLPEAHRFLDDDAASVARLFPVLAELPAVREIAARGSRIADPLEVRRRGFSGLREMLRRLSGSYLLVMWIDDLQWSDLDSTRLLQEVLAPPDPPRLLFIGSYRSEHADTSPVLKSLVRPDDAVHRIDVEQLSPEESTELARSRLGENASQAAIDAVVREAAGVPLFVEQLIHAVDQVQQSERDAPLTFEAVLRRRFALLSETARCLLEYVVVGGQPLPLGAILSAAQVAPEQALGDLSLLRAQQWVRTDGIGKGNHIEPFHDRIREILLLSLAPDLLKNYHLALATALEPLPVDPEILTVHWAGCGRFTEAIRYATLAADAAAGTLAFNRAARLYEQALAWQPAEAGDRQRLKVALAGALAHAGRSIEAGDAYLDAAEECALADALVYKQRAAEQYFNHGHVEKGYSVLGELVHSVGLRLPRRGTSALISMFVERARLRARRLVYRPSRRPARPEIRRQIDVCQVVGRGLAMIEPLRVMEFQSRALRLALDEGDPKRASIALALEAAFEGVAGHAARARVDRLLDESERLAAGLNDIPVAAHSRFIRGVTHYLRGEWSVSLAHCRAAESLLREGCVNVWWEIDQSVSFICWNLSYLGLLGEASAYIRPALKEAGERGDRLLISQLLSGMNVLIPLSQNEDPEQVRDDLVRKVRPWQGESYNMPHMLLTMALCHIDMFMGRGVDAHARITRDLPQIKGSLLPRVQLLNTDIQGFRARCAVAAASETSDRHRLLAEARDAARALDRIDAPLATAYATTTRAQLAIVAGASDSAIPMLTSAIAQFQALDMRMHAAACAYRLSGLIGGAAGIAKRAASISAMQTLGIKDPAAMTRVWLPVSEPSPRI